MELKNSKNGETSAPPDPNPDLENLNNDKTNQKDQNFTEDFDSTCSTPYVSAPSSPGRGPINGGFFYSCPASPMHFAITSTASCSSAYSVSAVSSPEHGGSVAIGYEFEFSARLGSSSSGGLLTGSMSSADELFLNGKIRPMKLSTHLERPQVLAPLLDLDEEEEEDEEEGIRRGRDLRLRDKSLRRRTRSMSPLRSTSSLEFENDEVLNPGGKNQIFEESITGESSVSNNNEESIKLEENSTTPSSVSASSSRSSSAGRNSKRWVFLKDFLYRSKSEGRSNNKFWSNISFSPTKEKKPTNPPSSSSATNHQQQQASGSKEKLPTLTVENQKVKGKPVNGVGKRRVPTSPHELHYKASKAQAEEMRKKTFLPYRQGLLGCLGFSSKGYGAMNGFARALNPVSSR